MDSFVAFLIRARHILPFLEIWLPLSGLVRGRLARYDFSAETLTWNKLVAVKTEKAQSFD